MGVFRKIANWLSYPTESTPSCLATLPDALVGPDFQVSLNVFASTGGRTSRAIFDGRFFRDGNEIRAVATDDTSRPHLIEAMIGTYCQVEPRVSKDCLQRFLSGSSKAKPLRLFPLGDSWRAVFSYDCGPSLDKFYLCYHVGKGVLEFSSGTLATSWDGDHTSHPSGQPLSPPGEGSYVAQCHLLYNLRSEALRALKEKDYETLAQLYPVFAWGLSEQPSPPEWAKTHHSLLKRFAEALQGAALGRVGEVEMAEEYTESALQLQQELLEAETGWRDPSASCPK